MNIVHRAILSGKVTNLPNKHTWKELKKHKKKDIYLFGATKASELFLNKYGRKFTIKGILDNDTDKQKKQIWGIDVVSPDILKTIDVSKIVIIICSTNYYVEIYEQLSQYNVKAVFSLVLMENNRLFVKLRLPIIQRYRKLMNRIWFYINHHWGWNKTNIKYRNIMKEGHREPIINNKIVFLASGRYNDHEKYICNALMEKEEDLDIVWILDSEKECPFNARYINSNDTQKVAYELATAKIWINSNVFPIYVTKRKGQIYIQTKHWSSITLKKFYFDTPVHFKTRPYLKSVWKNDVKMYDYILVGSEFDKKTCKAGFGYKGEFLEVGSPRTDALFYSTIFKKSIIQKYNLEEDVKLLLYAPTFRAKENAREYKSEAYSVVPDFLTLCNVITKKYGGMWKVALRLHPYIDTESVDLCKNENVIDMSQYEDIQELLAVSEVVITDYSSLMFEPAMVGKKVFLFTPDIEEYCAKERDLWFDLKELPFSYARNEQELFDNIMNHEEETYQRNVKAFFDYHGVHEDGHASERAAEFILDLIKE